MQTHNSKNSEDSMEGLNPSNLSSGHASVGEGKGEDGRKCRKGRECGKEKEIKGKWSVYLQPVHVTG